MGILLHSLPGQLPGEEVFGIETTGIAYPVTSIIISSGKIPSFTAWNMLWKERVVQIGEEIYHPKRRCMSPGIRKYQDYRADPRHPWQKIWMNVRTLTLQPPLFADGYRLRDVVLFKTAIFTLFRNLSSFVKRRGAKRNCKRTSLLFHEIMLNLALNGT